MIAENSPAIERFKANKASAISLVYLLVLTTMALLAPSITSGDPNQLDLGQVLEGFSGEHIFGTDHLGRDIATRILYGTRLSLLSGVGAVCFGLAIALPIGLFSGFVGGVTDTIVQRFVDALFAFPAFLMALALVAVLGAGLTNVIVAVGASTVPPMIRLVRSGVLSVKSEDYIENARSVGCSSSRIIIRHILPNTLGPIIVQATVYIGATIIAAAGLGFLGLGVQPPAAEWGAMLGEGRDYIFTAPHVLTVPGLFIFVTVLAFNYVGDGLRDALDPKTTKQ
ncbi:ABC transporter permease [Pseudaminobacter arsenicus]|uniref:ABC transporter permease n=1 Tax=Borborobacter arsenicus TaxID=1851146 RepID=A0A432UZZ6_9HYPH|nr:ABC transporter permease [Pseudaminobacter arsenicus]RUM95534.1 ABC transporter permease [Pseudaminobacter arsenicus]